MTNQLKVLNDHLFAQLDRLSNAELSDEQVSTEVNRTDAIVKVADKIIGGAAIALKACELVAVHGDQHLARLPMIDRPSDPYANQDYKGSKT